MSIRDTVSSDKRVSTVATGRRLSIPERGQGTGVTIQVLNVDNISAYEVHFEGAVIDGGATTYGTIATFTQADGNNPSVIVVSQNVSYRFQWISGNNGYFRVLATP